MPNDTPNFNLVNVTYNNATGEGNIQPTKYYEIVKKAYADLENECNWYVRCYWSSHP